MKIRKEIIEMNSHYGSGLIKKEDELKTNKSLAQSIEKSKADGITRWEKGGRIIKGDGTLAFCRMINKIDEHGSHLNQ